MFMAAPGLPPPGQFGTGLVADPSRAAHLLRAWIAADAETPENRRG